MFCLLDCDFVILGNFVTICFSSLIDAEYEFVGMGNRHVPTKCLALGKWDDPGRLIKLLRQPNKPNNLKSMVRNYTLVALKSADDWSLVFVLK